MGVFIGWVILSIIVCAVAKSKGRSGFAWFLISLLISPIIAVIVLLCIGDSDEKKEENINAALDVIEQRQKDNAQPDMGDMSQAKAIEDLKKYKDLLDLGAITQDEYDAKKKELMPLLRHDFKEPVLLEEMAVEKSVEQSTIELVEKLNPTTITAPNSQSTSKKFSRTDYVLGAIVLVALLLVGVVVWANFRDSKKSSREVVKEANLQVASIQLQDFYTDLLEIKNDPGFIVGKNRSFKRYKSWQKDLRKFDDLNKDLFDGQRVYPSKLLELGAEYYYTKGAENNVTRLLCSTFNNELPKMINPQVVPAIQESTSTNSSKVHQKPKKIDLSEIEEEKTVLSESDKKVVKQFISLYNELKGFKGNPDFKVMGFDPDGKYYDWLERVHRFETDANAQVLIKLRVVPNDLECLGMEYVCSKGKETEASQLFVGSIEDAIRQYNSLTIRP